MMQSRRKKPGDPPPPPTSREQFLALLPTLPEEALQYLVLACSSPQTAPGCKAWPDGIGGFTEPSQHAITQIRAAADRILRGE
jgi:hypothetical protein